MEDALVVGCMLITLHNKDLMAVNSANGETVQPEKQNGDKLDGAKLFARLEPASWNVIRFKKT
jgi:alpha-L-arabinofuranosidase